MCSLDAAANKVALSSSILGAWADRAALLVEAKFTASNKVDAL